MSKNFSFLSRLRTRLSQRSRQFMAGRYGTDKLNMAILGLGLLFCLLAMFNRRPMLDLLLTVFSYGLLGLAIFRMLSRNTYRRYRENRKYLQLKDRVKDRQNRYFDCPRCRQTVRVPRHKGKIEITCPKCKEHFVKKT